MILEFPYKTKLGTDTTIKYDTISDRFECDILYFIIYCDPEKPFINNLLSYIEELDKEIEIHNI